MNTAKVISPVSWSKESFRLAREKAYLNGELKAGTDKEKAPSIQQNYGKDSKTIGDQQVALSGYRLVKILTN